jgi:hypothetical protein
MMSRVATKKELKPSDFVRYFEQNKLGDLNFPVGIMYDGPSSGWWHDSYLCDFYIELNELYQIIVDWKIEQQSVEINNIVAIIAFGSVVGTKIIEIEKERKKYIFFGKKIKYTKTENVKPSDVDFYVLSKTPYIDEKKLDPVSQETYDCGTWIKKAGIHVVNRSLDQCYCGILDGTDTVSISAITKGVPIFMTDAFRPFKKTLDITHTEPLYELYWHFNKNGKLIGTIK